MSRAGPVNLALEFLVVLFELREDPVVLGLLDQGHLEGVMVGGVDEAIVTGDVNNMHEVGGIGSGH
jgi:hypothetical protein